MKEKIKTLEEIKQISEQLKQEEKKIVTTNGVFDILHVGHTTYLQQAKALGDVLIVGINSNSSVKQIKGPKRPLNEEQDRALCLAALACVDYVVIFEETDPREFLKVAVPNVHTKGGDYKGKEDKIIEKEIVESLGGTISLIDFVPEKSTTALIEKIIQVYKE